MSNKKFDNKFQTEIHILPSGQIIEAANANPVVVPPASVPLRQLSDLAIKKLEKRMHSSITSAMACAELLGKEAVIKILRKDSSIDSISATAIHLMIAESTQPTTNHAQVKNDLITLNKKKIPKIRVTYLRDYLNILKKRYGNPDGESLGRITIMGLDAIDRVLVRYYMSNFLIDPIVVSYLKKKGLVPDTVYDSNENRICWDPKHTSTEIKRYVEGQHDKRSNPVNISERINNLKGWVPKKSTKQFIEADNSLELGPSDILIDFKDNSKKGTKQPFNLLNPDIEAMNALKKKKLTK